MTVYGYARVSSRSQVDGFGLDAQNLRLKEAGAEQVFQDVFTGTTMDRPQWDVLMGLLQDGDTLVVAKLDRIARSAAGGCAAVKELVARGVTVNVLNMGVMSDTPVGRMIMTVMFAMAEFERDLIVERMAEGKAIAKTRDGYHEGRPKIDVDDSELCVVASAVQTGHMTLKAGAEKLGISPRTLKRRMEVYVA